MDIRLATDDELDAFPVRTPTVHGVIFDRPTWAYEEAYDWMESHGFVWLSRTETDTEYGFYLRTPTLDYYLGRKVKTINVEPGIRMLLGTLNQPPVAFSSLEKVVVKPFNILDYTGGKTLEEITVWCDNLNVVEPATVDEPATDE